MKHKRLRPAWKDAAQHHASACWCVPEWRYFDIRDASRVEIASAAMAEYRSRLNVAYHNAVQHPRSRKALERVAEAARNLASVGLFALEVGQ